MPQNAEEAIRQSFLKAKWYAEEERINEAQEKLDLYSDDYEEIIKEKLSDLYHPANYERMYLHVNQSQNILKRVINEISTIYKVEPQRTLSVESERYSDIKEETLMDVIMKKVNRYTNLLNECLIKVGVRYGRIVYDIITPNICTVIQNEDDPTQADAIIYQVTLKNTLGDDSIEYHYWDIEGDYYVFGKDFKLQRVIYDGEEAPSPYKDAEGKFIIPFVVFHRQSPDDAFFDQHTGRDLYNGAVLTGVKMTQFDYYFKSASHKQIYIIGDEVDVPQKQVLDPLTVFQAKGENASIGTLDLQANINQLKEALIYQVNSLINNYGISADQWTLSVSEMSGRALKIRNAPLLEIRQDQLPLYRSYEGQLFKVTRIVNNAWKFKPIPEQAEFSIDFGEITFPEDPEDELRLDVKRLNTGIISPGQFYMKYNPDIKDEKEAEKTLLENLEKIAKAKEDVPALDAAINAILGTKPEGTPQRTEEGSIEAGQQGQGEE